jgi:hypothetical protein
VLATLQDAGAELQSVIARRSQTPGLGVAFVTPLETGHEIRAAALVGFNVARSLHAVRVMGNNRPGVSAELARAAGDAGINLRGFSASVLGGQFVAYLGVDTLEDADRLMGLVQAKLAAKPNPKRLALA